MHWVDRGPEPEGLGEVRSRYMPGWVQYYSEGIGSKPTDSYWRCFNIDLVRAFAGLCAYCEETTKGELDHFRPKSRFPDLVYSWSNWVFACHECNNAKTNAWPTDGYVDPCAKCLTDRPERHFVFDTQTGFILPNRSLSPRRRQKAQRTIDDLGLSDWQHLKNRVEWLELFSAAMPAHPNNLTADTKRRLVRFASRERQLSSVVRAWLSEQRFPTERTLEEEPPDESRSGSHGSDDLFDST